MKILLINPQLKQVIKSNFPDEIDKKVMSLPPLGILYISAFLKKKAIHAVNFLDMAAGNISVLELEDIIIEKRPALIGIYTSTFNLPDVFLTAQRIKKIDPNIHITLGGPHVNIYPEETLLNSDIDSIVTGEGEIAFSELADALENNISLSNVKGILYRDRVSVIKTSPPELIENLDILPFPDRKNLYLKRYYNTLSPDSISTTMISSRGCPYDCIFCYHAHMGKGVRFRSSNNVVSEMEECASLGIRDIFFIDDVFTLNKKRTFEICNEIIERKLNIKWSIRTRVDSVDISMLKKLKAAGCERIQFGIEAGTSQILSILNKEITLAQAEEAFRLAKEEGIETLAYFMIGSPTETRDQILETIDFAIRLNPDYAHFSITMPFPDTELYKIGLERNIFRNDFWREFAKHPNATSKLYYWEECLSEKELCLLLKHAYKRFYFRPVYFLKLLLKPRSLKDLRKKIKMGIKLFEYAFS